MGDRALVLLLAFGAGLVLLGAFSWYRRRGGAAPERLDVDALGLELMAGCCAFVVFTSPSCRPCKAALRVVTDAATKTPGPTEVVSVDAVQRAQLALEADVRTIPTVFLITASGHVVRRWKTVPQPEDVEAALQAM